MVFYKQITIPKIGAKGGEKGAEVDQVSLFKYRTAFLEYAESEPDQLFRVFQSSPQGVTSEVARARLKLLGPNMLLTDHFTWYQQLWKAFLNPFNILLLGLATVSYLTDDVKGAIVMGLMVLMSVLLTFFQEFRSSRAAEKLKAMVSTHATVTRRTGYLEVDRANPVWMTRKGEIPIKDLVPGDLIHLSAGDMIPADIRLLTSKDLFVSQSALTGESLPVEKFALTEPKGAAKDLIEMRNLCFMGTSVVSGIATAIVIKTGSATYIGSIAQMVSGERALTSFDKGIRRFTWLMLRFMLVMVPMVFILNGLTKGNWFEAFMFAVAVAVGLTPEMLPMIVTVNLAKGALQMARKKVIVKRLSSIQNFGAMDILCTDKTGTLTQDKVILEKYVDIENAENPRVLHHAYLNSFFQTGLKNLLDIAILNHGEVQGSLAIDKNYKKFDEIPFDFQRRRLSIIVEGPQKKHVLICKGALEEMLSVCTQAELQEKVVPLNEEIRKRSLDIAQDLNDDGLRVIAVAYKAVATGKTDYSVKDESDLVLLGFVAFLDPPKESAGKAIDSLAQHGVSVKVLTGDNDRVTRNICKQVGLTIDRVLLGHEIERMQDKELEEWVDKVSVYAKLSPAQKERIVQALKSKGHTVGFMGDGINDAPALRAADVGISVDNAVDVAKESADIILLEKSLLILEQGVQEGRKVFGNIIKYIKMGASSNFGNMFSVLGASILLPFLPMMPLQILTQNLLYDLSQTAIPFDEVDEEYLVKPRRWQIGDIARFMIFIGPISSIFDYATFGLMWFVFKANTPATQSLFQSGWFVEGLLSQTLIVHMIRTQKIPFIQSRASLPLLLMTSVVMAAGVLIPFTSYGAQIGLAAIPKDYFPWLVGILLSYCVLTQVSKMLFIKKYGYH